MDKLEGHSSYYIIFVLALGVFMVNLDASIVNIVLPTMAKLFGVDMYEVSRLVLTYLLSFSGFLLIFGRLSDIYGANKIFGYGFLVFTLSSVLCAISPSFIMLELSRFLQGIGAAMLASTYPALVIKLLPAEIRGRAFGFITVAGGIGFAMGAPVGGYLTNYFNWRWIFWINVPIGIFSLISSRSMISRKSENEITSGKFDKTGAILSFGGLALITYLLNSGKNYPLLSAVPICGIIIFTAMFVYFLKIEKSCPEPLLDLSLFSNKNFNYSFAANILAVMTLDGMNFLFPFFFELSRKMTPDKIGLLLMLFPLISIFISPIAGYFADLKGPRKVCVTATIILAVSTAMLCYFNLNTSIYFIITTLLVFGCALAMFFTANTSLMMCHAPAGREGITSAMVSFNANLGTLLGICLFESVFSYKLPAGIITGKLLEGVPGIIAESFMRGAMFALVISIIAAKCSISAHEKNNGSVSINEEKLTPMTAE